MIRQLNSYLDRVKHIEDNPFWATQRSRAARTPLWRTLWRGYAGYAVLLMLPLLAITQYALSTHGVHTDDGRYSLGVFVTAAGVIQLLYVGIKAALSTAPSVVQARQQGTLLALALTRINSADFADGVALSESRNIVREFAVWTPMLAGITLLANQSIYSTLMLTAISALVVLYFAYNGILISATSKDAQEAGRKASQGTFVSLGGTCLGFVCGGFMLGPLWLLHPIFAYACSMWGTGSPMGMRMGDELSLLFWCGWPVFVLPMYVWMILNVRQSAIRALERVRII
jgi:hypothetical protein